MIRCPNCLNKRVGTVETVSAVAWLSPEQVDDEGQPEYSNEEITEVYWDTSVTEADDDRHPLMHCRNCSHEWHELTITLS
jgi:hypothetical protein